MKSTSCPACKAQFSLRQFFSYTTLHGTRRIKRCPHCGVMLRWARKPLIVMNTGSAILIAAAVSVFLFSERLFDSWNTPTVLFAVGAGIALLSFTLLRFEQVADHFD